MIKASLLPALRPVFPGISPLELGGFKHYQV